MPEIVNPGGETVKPIPTKETTTTETVKLTGTPQPAPPPAPEAADDNVRKWMAAIVMICFTIIILASLYALFFYSKQLPNDVLPIVTGLIGTVFGYWAGYAGAIINYLYGSSSGSTAKSTLLGQGK